MSNNNPQYYKINGKNIGSIFAYDESFPMVDLSKYTHPDGTLKGITKTEPWQISADESNENVTKYYKQTGFTDDLTKFKPVLTGSSPKFKKCIEKGAGSYTIKYNREKDALIVGPTTVKASDFPENKVPDRMIMTLQGAGGGGGGTCNVYIVFFAAGGGNGGGGGAGGFCAVVLNIKKLKDIEGSKYRIIVGKGGQGSPSLTTKSGKDGDFMLFGNGTMRAPDAEDGEDSRLDFVDADGKSTTLITIQGGKRGETPYGYDSGNGGKGGTVNANAGENDYWWDLPCTSGNKKQDNCFFTGGSGGSYDQNGENTTEKQIRAISDKNYYSKLDMYITIGNKASGVNGEGNASRSGGGGASYLAAGGNGGAPEIKGSDDIGRSGISGKDGSGGGGGLLTFGGVSVTGMAALASLRGGGNGGDGKLRLYY